MGRPGETSSPAEDIVATDGFEDDQIPCVVTFWVVPFDRLAVAVRGTPAVPAKNGNGPPIASAKAAMGPLNVEPFMHGGVLHPISSGIVPTIVIVADSDTGNCPLAP